MASAMPSAPIAMTKPSAAPGSGECGHEISPIFVGPPFRRLAGHGIRASAGARTATGRTGFAAAARNQTGGRLAGALLCDAKPVALRHVPAAERFQEPAA